MIQQEPHRDKYHVGASQRRLQLDAALVRRFL
jgi:hypothetical protein